MKNKLILIVITALALLCSTPALAQDSDGDGYSGAADCNDADPNNWLSCASCADADFDGWWAGCDAYVTHSGPDCNNGNSHTWNTCATCIDGDGDGWVGVCNNYLVINGPDCDDSNTNAWTTCATCVDVDADNAYLLCDRYAVGNGPDCNDANHNTWNTCPTCVDADSDGRYVLCDNYDGIDGPDCSDTNTFAWNSCGSCLDPDRDAWWGICDRYSSPALTTIIGTGTWTTGSPLATSYHDHRSQIIYLSGDLKVAGNLIGLALDVSHLADQALNNFTIRMKHTTLDYFQTTAWETTGWTVVYQANVTISATGWFTFNFTTPFAYNGSENLMIDFSFNNSSLSDSGWVHYTSSSQTRTLSAGSNSADGDPLYWSGSLPSASIHSKSFNLKLMTSDPFLNHFDCAPDDINHWSDCGFCMDADGDDRGLGCDKGDDCDDTNINNWASCATCVDADADGWHIGCDQYLTINGRDKNDADTNNWASTNCRDSDGDGWYYSCDRYVTISGPDCNDSNTNTWDSCATCKNSDGDTWYAGCNRYVTISGPDCNDANSNIWSTCATCVDADRDGWFGLCDRFVGTGSFVTTGTGIATADYPLATGYKDARTQVIYLASELGPAGSFTGLALDVTQVPGQVLKNFTIRMKQTPLSQYATAEWDGPASNWVTVFRGDVTISVTGWKQFNFSQHFVYDGVSNMIIDFSFYNSSISNYGYVRFTSGNNRCLLLASHNLYGDPLTWSGSSPAPVRTMVVPNLRLYQGNGPDCNDAAATVHAGQPSPEGPGALCDGLDNQCPGDAGYGAVDEGCEPPDADGDGLSDGQEVVIGTNPNVADTDGDGLNDGEEYDTFGTDPLGWDSDNDLLPDAFEVANSSGHPDGQNLNPLVSDSAADFDGDGIANADDYWNGGASRSGGGAWVADKIGFAACGYWGEGDGDGFVSPSDLAVISLAVKGSPDYAAVYPPTGETQDMDADGFLSPGDQGILSQMIKGQELAVLGSRPTALSRVVPATGVNLSGAVGEAVTVTVAVTNTATTAAPGVPVVFSIAASSTGSATIVGGEGADAVNTRYDLTTARADGGQASATLVLTAAGTVTVEAKVKQCGADGVGRYCAEVLLAEPVTITVTP